MLKQILRYASPLVRRTAAYQTWQICRRAALAQNPTRTENHALRTVREFNSCLAPAADGVLTIGVIWEGSGRFDCLLEVNDPLRSRIVRIPRAVFNPGWLHHLAAYLDKSSKEVVLGEYALDRYLSPRYVSARAAFRSYCSAAVRALIREFGIDVFLMPKLNDDWTIDFIHSLRDEGAKLVVDDREGTVTPQRMKTVPSRLKELLKVDFDLLTTHNGFHHRLFVDSGLPSERMVINGEPQSDYWHRPATWRTRSQIHPRLREDRIVILFFSFGPRTYMNFYYGDETRDWTGLCAEYHEVLLDLMRQHGDRIQIVYKSGGKPLRDLYAGFGNFIELAAPFVESGVLLQLDGTYNSFDLIRTSDIVLGFQTSGMIEAMFTERPIVYGAWGPLYDEIRDTLLPLHEGEATFWCRSRADLAITLGRLIAGGVANPLSETSRADRNRIRELFFHRPDGKVAERLLAMTRNIARGFDPLAAES